MARLRRSRRSRAAASDEERTYSIWPFAAAFVVLGAIGLAALLMKGSPSTPTETIPAFTTTSSTSSTTSLPSVTAPGGAPAPDGVTDVVVTGDVTSFAFATPASFSSVPLRAEVARASAVASADGSGIVVATSCAMSDEEVLAQVSVTTSPTTITVLPVVVAPDGAPPCAGEETSRRVELPLGTPLGDRSIVVVPAGTAVPPPGT